MLSTGRIGGACLPNRLAEGSLKGRRGRHSLGRSRGTRSRRGICNCQHRGGSSSLQLPGGLASLAGVCFHFESVGTPSKAGYVHILKQRLFDRGLDPDCRGAPCQWQANTRRLGWDDGVTRESSLFWASQWQSSSSLSEPIHVGSGRCLSLRTQSKMKIK
jgi:hypothetical protein